MKKLIIAFLLVLFSSPALAQSSLCSITGPGNCTTQSEDVLMELTHKAVDRIQLTQDPHPFKTKNDEVLQAYARQNAHANNTVATPAQDRDWTFWR